MNSQNLWDRYCKLYRSYPEAGFTLDISRMRFQDSLFAELAEPMKKAFAAMKELEAGSIANPDEKRMVGHYWLRTPELAPTPEIRQAIEASGRAISEFAAAVHSGKIRGELGEKFTHLLLVGIGGSALGPQLVSDALSAQPGPMKILFCDNTDPDGITRTLQAIAGVLGQTLTIVISKSGGTVEPRNGMLEIGRAYADGGLQFEKHAVAVTCRGSKLDATAAKWLKSFELWDWVGGRTSLFSAVGLLPAALEGIPISEFIAGASQMDAITRVPNAEQNPAALLAMMWFAAGGGRGKKDMVVLPYKDRLVLLSKYLQQLVMESLGKEKDLSGSTVNQGIAVYGNKGSTDQHAYVQQLRDGVNNFFATFIQVLTDYTGEHAKPLEVDDKVTSGDYLTGFLLGTRQALYEKERDSITLTIEKLTPRSLGGLIALYERAVGFYASLVNVNAYHQPGVEAGKKAAERVVQLQQKLLTLLAAEKGKAMTAAQLAEKVDAKDEAEMVYKILEHLAANDGRKIRRAGAGDPAKAEFSLG